MKRYLGLILLIGGIAAAAIALVRSQSARADEAERELAWSELQREYLERASLVRSNADPKAYTDEARLFYGWYFKRVEEFHKRFPGNRPFDAYLKELAERGGDTAPYEAAYKFVRQNFDALMNGTYAPLYTAEDKGLRFDLVAATVRPHGMGRKIRWDLAVWGAPRSLVEDSRGARKMVASAQFKVAIKLLRKNKRDLPYEMTIDGDPAQKIEYPERFLAAFPAQAVLGHYDLDPVPADVEKAEITFTLTSRSNTGETVATFPWTLDVPDEWKLKPGEAWEGATETEAVAEDTY